MSGFRRAVSSRLFVYGSRSRCLRWSPGRQRLSFRVTNLVASANGFASVEVGVGGALGLLRRFRGASANDAVNLAVGIDHASNDAVLIAAINNIDVRLRSFVHDGNVGVGADFGGMFHAGPRAGYAILGGSNAGVTENGVEHNEDSERSPSAVTLIQRRHLLNSMEGMRRGEGLDRQPCLHER